jgi:hypothetical protein
MRRSILALIVLLLGATDARAQSTPALLDTVQKTTFQYFWYEANPANGLVRDRSTPGSPCSIAATGFGLSAICVGIDHGWVSREAGRDRVLTTLNTFWTGPQGSTETGTIGYQGLFYHFLDMNTALRFVQWNNVELSSIDTALLFAGILDCKQYFTGGDPTETQIRALADSIYRRADWEWMRDLGSGIRMGWLPASGFTNFGQWQGYNEAMILYLLALGSPTHPVPTTTWNYWMSGYLWYAQFGQTYLVFAPLFGHQYSHCWVDFRLGQDAFLRAHGTTYFENSRRATLAQRAYAIANPGHWTGYSDSLWGITASDIKGGYSARGAPPAQNDDGTITPTAPLGSIAFAPDEVLPVVRNLFNHYPLLWGPYGFRDAFNLSTNPVWYDTDYLGIDEGPIVLMIENHLRGSVWNRFMANPDMVVGLQRAGFTAVAAVEGPAVPAGQELMAWSEPNPFTRSTTIRFRLPAAGPVRLDVFDLSGRRVADLLDGARGAGEQSVAWQPGALPSGVYYLRLEAAGRVATRRCVRLQ